MTIIDEIIAKRKEEIASGTDTGGFTVPSEREVPVSLFGQEPFIIAEVKKKSPSKGVFTESFNHLQAASSYIEQGIKNISVITEKNYFAGSLQYLYEIKKKYPETAILRKDFLVCENDIEVSYNCGADALLLIASALEKSLLEKFYYLTLEKGMKPLVELHDKDDLEKVKSFKPILVGINSRDLKDFSVDMISPLLLRREIDWEADVVYESGIGSRSDAVFAFSSGFSGILTGESVIKNPLLASVYIDSFFSVKEKRINPERYFWNRIYSKAASPDSGFLSNNRGDSSSNISLVAGCSNGNSDVKKSSSDGISADSISRVNRPDSRNGEESLLYSRESNDPGCISKSNISMNSSTNKNSRDIGSSFVSTSDENSRIRRVSPLVKICGITNREDCEAAYKAGADMIGMVFAPSVRKADITLPEKIRDIDIPKVAVLVNPDKELVKTLEDYYERGLIDAVQLSGDETPEFCAGLDIPFYKTLRIKNADEYDSGEKYRSVRILTDSYSKNSYGGTGKKVAAEILESISVKAKGGLWLAGGMSCENVSEIAEKYLPELIDASSSLEISPGKKDLRKMEEFIKAAKGL